MLNVTNTKEKIGGIFEKTIWPGGRFSNQPDRFLSIMGVPKNSYSTRDIETIKKIEREIKGLTIPEWYAKVQNGELDGLHIYSLPKELRVRYARYVFLEVENKSIEDLKKIDLNEFYELLKLVGGSIDKRNRDEMYYQLGSIFPELKEHFTIERGKKRNNPQDCAKYLAYYLNQKIDSRCIYNITQITNKYFKNDIYSHYLSTRKEDEYLQILASACGIPSQNLKDAIKIWKEYIKHSKMDVKKDFPTETSDGRRIFYSIYDKGIYDEIIKYYKSKAYNFRRFLEVPAFEMLDAEKWILDESVEPFYEKLRDECSKRWNYINI